MVGDRARDQPQAFKQELRACFDSEQITDVTVQQYGAAVTGWEMDPARPLAAWTPGDPVEFAIFSLQSLAQAMAAGLGVDRSLSWQGKYVSLLLQSDGTKPGFAETPIGLKLRALGERWSALWPEHPEVRFRLCLSAEPFAEGPFANAVVVLAPG